MERKKKEDSIVKSAERLLNEFQACNEFQITGLKRKHVLRKFRDSLHSTNSWTRIFREQRIL
jgi:hypothetical protein